MKYIYCCDWGTTSLRLRLANAETAEIIDQEKVGVGIASVFNLWKIAKEQASESRTDFYLSQLKNAISLLAARNPGVEEDTLLVLSGMASSSVGMIELPYAELPFSLTGKNILAHHVPPTATFKNPVLLLSGVKDGSEVMRGEETQLIGISAILSQLNMNDETVVLLPGTHSKHVHITNGAITGIETYITGELFSILSNNGLLKEAVQSHNNKHAGNDWEAFLQGVEYSGTTSLLQALFKVRTNQLFNEFTKPQNYDYLSGILIGYELRNLRQQAPSQVLLCCESNLYHHYRKAMDALGLSDITYFFDPQEIEHAVVRGQVNIARTHLNELVDEPI